MSCTGTITVGDGGGNGGGNGGAGDGETDVPVIGPVSNDSLVVAGGTVVGVAAIGLTTRR